MAQAQPLHLTPEAVASLPPPGLSAPSALVFSPGSRSAATDAPSQRPSNATAASTSGRYLAFISSSAAVLRTVRSPPALYRPLTGNAMGLSASGASSPASPPNPTASSGERILQFVDLEELSSFTNKPPSPRPLLSLMRHKTSRNREGSDHAISSVSDHSDSLEERLRRERQRLTSSGSLTQFSWTAPTGSEESVNASSDTDAEDESSAGLRLLVPARGSLFLQYGIGATCKVDCIYDKSVTGMPAMDAQLSPDGSMVAWTAHGDVYVQAAASGTEFNPIRLTFGSSAHATQHHSNNDNDSTTTASCVSHGVADFVAQEEMDRYRGFWWHPDNSGILLTRVDETNVPLFRIMHQDCDEGGAGSNSYEDHRYPFAGKENPHVRLTFLPVDKVSILDPTLQAQENDAMVVENDDDDTRQDVDNDDMVMTDDGQHQPTAQSIATQAWDQVFWLDPPREASEYLARVHWLHDGSAVAQWQNRTQTVTVWQRILIDRNGSVATSRPRTLLVERSQVWINLHHMFYVLDYPIAPSDCGGPLDRDIPPFPSTLPPGAFSFILASERTGFQHLYLYTFCPEINGEQAVLIRTISSGEWMAENIVGVDMEKDAVYFTGTCDSVLERHLYALPITNRAMIGTSNKDIGGSETSDDHNGVRLGLSKVMNAFAGKSSKTGQNGVHSCAVTTRHPIRLTVDAGMHSIVMDEECLRFSDTSSDVDRPTSVRVFELPKRGFNWEKQASSRSTAKLIATLYDAMKDDKSMVSESLANQTSMPGSVGSRLLAHLPTPELISFPTSDGTETLHAALYRPDPRLHGPGPYPLVCAVYGGPHVQRVNRSWSQCADMRAQRLRSLGFVVAKCDNRGSSRRGLAFESAIRQRLGRLEVLDQVALVRQLTARGIADANRVGIYGWSYGGYLAAMCLSRAPDVFDVAVAGAPVTSWDGYDTHYTERYMGLPADNPSGYRESAVFDHIPNIRGKMMIVHGLIDENVHFRHTARMINKLIAAGKDYELLIFPDERHSPRRLRDRIYMEQRISDFFSKHLASMDVVDLVAMNGASNTHSLRPHL